MLSICLVDYVNVYVVYNWGEPERAPPRALKRLRSLSHNDDDNGGISYVLPNAHARSYVESSKVSRVAQGKRERLWRVYSVKNRTLN